MSEVKKDTEVGIRTTKTDGNPFSSPDVCVPVKWRWLIYIVVNCNSDMVDLSCKIDERRLQLIQILRHLL